jgi:hypothetical protein
MGCLAARDTGIRLILTGFFGRLNNQ